MNSFALDILGLINNNATLSIEEANGQLTIEKEYIFYGKVKDLEALMTTATTRRTHEQWLVFETEDKTSKMRIRAIDDQTYILTVKRKKEGMTGQFEIECPISKDMFNAMRLIGSGGRKCTRYTFPIQGTELTWEIDVYVGKNGGASPWVKIDLEVKAELQDFPPLPAEFEVFISHQPSAYTDEEKAQVRQCWDMEWANLDGEGMVVSQEDKSKK